MQAVENQSSNEKRTISLALLPSLKISCEFCSELGTMKRLRTNGAGQIRSQTSSTIVRTGAMLIALLLITMTWRSIIPSLAVIPAASDSKVSKESHIIAAMCAKDYEPCAGGLPTPVSMLHCCSAGFYCFRRGPYFSQCRPSPTDSHEQNAEENHIRLSRNASSAPMYRDKYGTPRKARVRLCAPDYGVCAAGAGADSSIPCCNHPFFKCALSTPFYHQCLPASSGSSPSSSSDPRKHRTGLLRILSSTRHETGRWFRVRDSVLRGPHKSIIYSYLTSTTDVDIAKYEAVSAVEKLEPLMHSMLNRSLNDLAMFSGIGVGRTDLLSLPGDFDAKTAIVTVAGILPSQTRYERRWTDFKVELSIPSDSKVLSFRNGLVIVQCRYPLSLEVAMSLATLSEVRDLEIRLRPDM